MTINVTAAEKIVLFGDSLMAGYGLNKEDHLSTVLESELIKQGYDLKVINASVSGDTTAGGLNRIDWTLSEKNIGILVLISSLLGSTKISNSQTSPQFPPLSMCMEVRTPIIESLPQTINASTDSSLTFASSKESSHPIVENSMKVESKDDFQLFR